MVEEDKPNFLIGLVLGLIIGGCILYLYYDLSGRKVTNYVETICDCTSVVDRGDCKIVISGLLSENSTISIDADIPVSITNNTFISVGPSILLESNNTGE